jgi:putative oxidoreductase
MNILLIIGRLAFAGIFLFSGANKLMDVGGTAAYISSKVVLPAAAAGLTAQLEAATGMTTPQLMAIAAGVVELVGGLMIVANIGIRLAAILLIVFTAAATFWFHDFWNQTGVDQQNNIAHALKNISIIGALIVFFVMGSWRPDESASEPTEPHM